MHAAGRAGGDSSTFSVCRYRWLLVLPLPFLCRDLLMAVAMSAIYLRATDAVDERACG
jgi:hypothetical protein